MASHSLCLSARSVTLDADAADWPSELDAVTPRPGSVRVVGSLGELSRAVAVVGTRRADPEALAFTRDFAAALAEQGLTIVSGGALGVDTAAHRGALDVEGRTLAVLGTGLRRLYPPRNAELFHRIVAARGALLTEAPDHAAPKPFRFLRRNALIAAMVRAVVVVQAPWRSGALSTAAYASALGKPVFAVPAAPWDLRGRGFETLLSRGARICTSPSDVLSVAALGVGSKPELAPRATEKPKEVEGLDDDERQVLALLSNRSATVDALASEAGLPARRVQRALLTLVLLGLADEREAGRYVGFGSGLAL